MPTTFRTIFGDGGRKLRPRKDFSTFDWQQGSNSKLTLIWRERGEEGSIKMKMLGDIHSDQHTRDQQLTQDCVISSSQIHPNVQSFPNNFWQIQTKKCSRSEILFVLFSRKYKYVSLGGKFAKLSEGKFFLQHPQKSDTTKHFYSKDTCPLQIIDFVQLCETQIEGV